jgi:hypothetical protein
MPNHCCNTLYLNADSLSLIVKKYIRKDDNNQDIFDFERIEPIGDVPDWYEQRINKWGTKWVGYDLYIGESTIDFFTAWSPPIPIIKKLAELHKDFVFRLEYYEDGNAFRGVATAKWEKGEVLLEDNCWDMTDNDYEELGLV